MGLRRVSVAGMGSRPLLALLAAFSPNSALTTQLAEGQFTPVAGVATAPRGVNVLENRVADALDALDEGEQLLEVLPPLSPDHETLRLAVASLRETASAL